MTILVTERELMANAKPPQWVIPDIIEEDTLACVLGRWASGKSFIALNMAMAVAYNAEFAGRKVNKGGPVVYVMGEGFNGMSRRVAAWHKFNKEPDIDGAIAFTKRSVHVNNEQAAKALKDDIDEAVNTVWNGVNPKLIIVDTFQRNFAGSENDGKEVSEFIYMLDHYLRTPYKACVCVVHHTGHGEGTQRRGRGSSVLPASVDTEYLVEMNGHHIQMDATKVKDAPKPNPETLIWELQEMELMLNGDKYFSAALDHVTPERLDQLRSAF